MRPLLIVALSTFATLGGCVDAEERTALPTATANDSAAAAALPENLSVEENVVGATPSSPAHASEICEDVAAGPCYTYEITLATEANVSVLLTWNVSTNDFDLILSQNDEEVARSARDPPGTKESLAARLAPGEYHLVVVAYVVTSDTFQLEAGFTEP